MKIPTLCVMVRLEPESISLSFLDWMIICHGSSLAALIRRVRVWRHEELGSWTQLEAHSDVSTVFFSRG